MIKLANLTYGKRRRYKWLNLKKKNDKVRKYHLQIAFARPGRT